MNHFRHVQVSPSNSDAFEAIVTVFAGRLYGHRAKGVRKRVETVLKECEQEEETDGTGQPHHQVAP